MIAIGLLHKFDHIISKFMFNRTTFVMKCQRIVVIWCV